VIAEAESRLLCKHEHWDHLGLELQLTSANLVAFSGSHGRAHLLLGCRTGQPCPSSRGNSESPKHDQGMAGKERFAGRGKGLCLYARGQANLLRSGRIEASE
jgi:hypothetical protein